MLELIKQLLNVSLNDTSKDIILNHFLTKSQNAIKKYLNIDTIDDTLNDSIADLAIFYYKNPDGITYSTQGARSKNIVDGIPESIKCSLPLPKVKVM